MKVKLLKEFRKRFAFTNVHGYSEMVDKKTGVIYGPNSMPMRNDYSIKENLITKAFYILTGKNRWDEQIDKKRKRHLDYLRKKTIQSATPI